MLIAIDTSSFVAYVSGEQGRDVDLLDRALTNGSIMLPPIVFVELLSDPKLPKELEKFLKKVPRLEVLKGYWERAGKIRALILSKKIKGRRLKVRLGDSLIAQSCIDHKVPLITRDRDFKHFAKYTDLELL